RATRRRDRGTGPRREGGSGESKVTSRISATGAASLSREPQPVTADPPTPHSNGPERSGQNPLPPTCRQLIGSVRFARYSSQELATASHSLTVGTLCGLEGRTEGNGPHRR